MKRITIVAFDVAPVGGMERHLTEVITGIAAAGHEVTVVARRCELPSGVPHRFVRIPAPRRPFALTFPVFWLLATAFLARRSYDVLHVHGGIVGNRSDLYTMHFCHAGFSERFGVRDRSGPGIARRMSTWVVGRLSLWGERWSLRPGRTGRLVAISAGVGRETEAHYPWLADRISVIPYGVDSEHFLPGEARRRSAREALGYGEEDNVAVFVGGEWMRKGLRHAIEALAAAPDWRLLVVGSGPVHDFVRLAEGAGVANRVTFAGPQADVRPHLAAADAFLFPTLYETFSLATHEAAAAGLPLLVTRVHGVEDLLIDGVNGFFVQPRAAAIADALRRLPPAGERREALGSAAREAARPLTWAAAVNAHLELLADA